ncbi:hypothetical protein [Streptomyces griseorubiginosus]|uniref:hypothetical protein n=1 Tax=Streptomyces griseorubiginosus TaxID=67304 RepID=UPI0036E652E9
MPQGPYGPPNPYNQPPPQGPYAPGPYAQQQPYGPPPVPPQQQPYGNPYPQQQPYGWGAPPVAPPPKRRPLVVILAVVGGLVALGVAGSVMRGVEEASGSGYPDAEYSLDLPRTLVDGRYELARNLSDSEAARTIEDQSVGAPGYKDVKAAVAQYSLGGDDTKGTLVVSGMYGRFKNPDRVRESLLDGAAEGEDSQIAISEQDFHPDGADGTTVTCEVLTKDQGDTKLTVPICAWGDGNTGAAVAELTTATATTDPLEIDLDKAAATTAQVRAEMRKPIR